MESAQISGKVFRFLSTMHPSLSKTERKRYSEFDPDKWYPWTADIAGEFADLMKRSPRDTSFARGFAYAATKGLPEDVRLTPTQLVGELATLPAAFGDGSGSGFEVSMENPGFASVSYRGMPGFSNVCIAILGELTQRLQSVGAKGLEVKHTAGCRLQGADACNFEVRWAADAGDVVPESARSSAAPAAAVSPSAPAAGRGAPERPAPVRAPEAPRPAPRPAHEAPPISELASARAASSSGPRPAEPGPSRSAAATPSPASSAAEPVAAAPAPVAAAAPAVAAAPVAAPSSTASGANSAQDLFDQLRSRLVDAEQQATRHLELETRIATLEAALAAAEAEARFAGQALADLRQRLRDLADEV